jgi:hypothetical protein
MTGEKLNGDKWEPQEGVLRFEVSRGPEHVEAFISRATCQASGGWLDGGLRSGGSLAEFVRQHRSQLDRIVLGKLNAGARHPVVVMARDLRPPAVPAIDARPGLELVLAARPLRGLNGFGADRPTVDLSTGSRVQPESRDNGEEFPARGSSMVFRHRGG